MTSSSFVTDSFDYKGSPADRSATGGWVSAALILGIEVCERLSTMGISANLVTYLVGTMHLPSSTSAKIVSDFAGTGFLLCLPGGVLADSILGKYWAIVIFSLVEVLGVGVLTVSVALPRLRPPPCDTAAYTCERANGLQMGVFYTALYLIAVGIGGIKSCVSGFGTEQFDEKDEKEKAQMVYFFNRFFFFISIGTLLAVTVLIYMQDEVGRKWAYGTCGISALIAIVAFLMGTRQYRYRKCLGSPIARILQVVVAALRKRNLEFPSNVELIFEDSLSSSRIQHTHQFHCLDKAAIIVEGDGKINSSSTLPSPWRLCSVTQIEETKMVIRLLPIFATTIMFWTIHAQMLTFSIAQVSTMDRLIGKFQFPAGSFTAFFVASIMITLSIYDRIIMPQWKKWKGKPGFTNLQRIAIGLTFSIIGMAAALLCERKRLSVSKSVGGSVRTLPISAFWLIPQFVIVGMGEAFMYTGQLDFFITQSPKGMKAMSTGLFLTTISLGYYVSSTLISIVKKVTRRGGSQGWLADSVNDGRLDLFYALLAVLCSVNLVVYLVCAAWYKPHTVRSGGGEGGVALQDVVVATGSSFEEETR